MRFWAVLWLVFTLFGTPLLAVSLLGYNVYERSDRVDVMLSFDAPYTGQIYSKRENGTTSLILGSLSFNENINKQLSSEIISSLAITPVKSSLAINLHSKNPISVGASKTSDGFGLRIRITPQSTQPSLNQEIATNISEPSRTSSNAQNPNAAPISGDDELISWRYLLVVALLVVLLLGLMVFRKFALNRGNSAFSRRAAFLDKLELKQGVETIYERPLDAQNRVVLLEYNSRQYLVLVGSTNVLLDRFGENISSEDEFSAFFEENKRRISAMIQQRQNSLDSYKDKMNKT